MAVDLLACVAEHDLVDLHGPFRADERTKSAASPSLVYGPLVGSSSVCTGAAAYCPRGVPLPRLHADEACGGSQSAEVATTELVFAPGEPAEDRGRLGDVLAK
jgi:hypothetical protein